MDPASASELRDFLSRSNSRMDHQDEQTAVSNRAIQTLVSQVSKLTTQLQRLQTEPEQRPTASNSPAPTIPDQAARFIEPRLPPPAFYSGEPQLCRSFLAKCSLYISLQPSSFPTEESKIAFVITLLSGRAALWGTTVWEQKLPCCTSFQSFSEEIRKVFDRAASGREAARFLAELRQGDRSVTDFSIEFRTLAAECRWNPEAQWDMFFHGLADYVKDEIYALELPTSLDGLVSLAIRVDARLQQRGQRARRTSANNRLDHLPIPYRDADIGFAEPDPMQMGRSRLSLEEKRRRRNEGLYLYCGAAGHIAALCSVNARETAVKGLLRGGITLAKSSLAATLLTVKLQWSSVTHDCQALIDSGAEGNFLDSDLADRLRLPVIALSQPIAVHALNGLSLSSITHSTGPLRLVTSGNHIETIQFLLTDTPVTPVVLGHPWLVLHNPHFNWSQSSILSWSEGCHATCLLSACPSVSCSVFQDEHMDLSNVPSEYRDLKGVFSKSRRLPISSLCLNYHLPERQRLLSLTTFFAFMVSRQTWSLTGGLSLSLNFGVSFAVC